MRDMKLLLHVTDDNRWSVALGNAANFINDVGEDRAQVIIVANGSGVFSFAQPDRLMEILSGKGVEFRACRNSLQKLFAAGKGCTGEEGLPPYVKVVPAGMTEIVRLHKEGFAYVRP
jgi:hypothetical protein